MESYNLVLDARMDVKIKLPVNIILNLSCSDFHDEMEYIFDAIECEYMYNKSIA